MQIHRQKSIQISEIPSATMELIMQFTGLIMYLLYETTVISLHVGIQAEFNLHPILNFSHWKCISKVLNITCLIKE